MFSAIIKALGGSFVTELISALMEPFKLYTEGKISEAELKAKVTTSLAEIAAKVDIAYADALTKTFASFTDVLKQSRLMQWVWGIVTISQLLVLVWHQVGIPALVYITGHPYPSSGATVEWAYLLLAGLVGLGPVVLKGRK